MKKNNLLKALLIVFLVYVVLSWIIPTGYYSSTGFNKGSIMPVGIFDLIIYPLVAGTSSVFILTAIVILFIGGLYGVLNKTGAYSKLLDNLAKKFKEREKLALVIITLVFVLLASFTGLTLPLLVFVPLFATLLMMLGFNKLTVMLSTIGGILVGNMASTYGFNVAGYISYLTENINNSILLRLLMLVLVTIALILTLLKICNIKSSKNEEIPLYEKNVDKKSNTMPLFVMLVLTFIVIFIGMFNWNGVFGIDLFDNIHKSITEFKIGNYTLFGNLIGSLPAIGSWTNYELCLVLVLASFIIGKLYKVKFSKIVDGFVDGMKQMVPVALWTMAASLIFLLMNTNTVDSNVYNIFNTISNYLLNLSSKLNVITLSTTSLIGSILFNDFPYLLSSIYYPVTNLSGDTALVGIVTQSIHGIVQLIAPTSVILVAGLSYFKIDYLQWLKKIWKLLLSLFAIIVIVLIVFAIVA